MMNLQFLKSHIVQRVVEFFKYYGGGLYERLDKHNVFLLSSGLAFSLVTCMLPFVLILFSIMGQLLELPVLKAQIAVFIDNLIPYEESSEMIKQVVFDRVSEFQRYKTLAGYLGIFGVLFAASGLFSSMRTILNTVFKVRIGKHILVGKLRDFAMVLFMVVLFLLATFILPLIDILQGLANRINFFDLILVGFLSQFLFSLLSFFILFVIFFLIYYFVPYARPPKRAIALSAFWSAILWEIAKQAFSFYVANSANLTRIYGTYLFIVVIIFWLYYSSIVFIVSAEIGQLYRERMKLKIRMPKTADKKEKKKSKETTEQK